MNCIKEQLKPENESETHSHTPSRDRISNNIRCEDLSRSECDDVREFLLRHVSNHGVLHLMLEFCQELAARSTFVW